MREIRHPVRQDTITVHIPETDDDLREFSEWFHRVNARGPISLDTETTGLDVYTPGFRLRLVQFSDEHNAWVLPFEKGGWYPYCTKQALKEGKHFLIHNAPFDWAVLDRHAGFPIESLAPKTTDTRLMAGLVDPRQPQEGGIGTALKPLSAYYVDPDAADTQGGLTAVFRSLKLTKATGWAGIDLDEPTYNLYAGLDVIYTARLYRKLVAEHKRLRIKAGLLDYEHQLARMCAVMRRTGMVLDVEYTRDRDQQLFDEAEMYTEKAISLGVENPNSTKQLSEALVEMGEKLKDTTPSGALKVDGPVLLALADMNTKWERLNLRSPNPLADSVIRSKRAGKWQSAYTGTFLETLSAEGRVHANINSMQARTGRMSITRPALQTLPSSDVMIRSCLLAEEGHVFLSTDFQAIEMRVLAALAGVKAMAHGFKNADSYPKDEYPRGFDIHMYTARLIKGAGATDDDRGLFKGAGFGKVYGGGVATLARQTGAPEHEIQQAVRAYDTEYPEIKRVSTRWQQEARANNWVYTSITGRRLPLDRHRMYAVVNYACQSVGRDCLGQAMLNMDRAGLLPYMRLPIHDEVLFSIPKGEKEEYQREIEKCMTFDLMGIPITCSTNIGERSWGSVIEAKNKEK